MTQPLQHQPPRETADELRRRAQALQNSGRLHEIGAGRVLAVLGLADPDDSESP